MSVYEANSLWNSILSSEVFAKFNLENFKDSGVNNKIAQYNHHTHGLLFFKNILFQMANVVGLEKLKLLEKIPNRHVGGGITINYERISFDLDYLSSIEEIVFLEKQLPDVTTILEIGAGYGRTCHSILSIFEQIEQYVIVDLSGMLNLSKQYLEKVLNKNLFNKIKFLDPNQFELERGIFDLVINIDSMQEMDEMVVLSYLNFIKKHANIFYTKNTVSKFCPSTCGWEKNNNSKLAMNSGLLKEVIDIFCPLELLKAQKRFLNVFLPGEKWTLLKHAASLPWSHYYQALYIKEL